MTVDNKKLLIQKLETFIRKYYNNIAIRGGIIFSIISLILFISISLFEYYHYSNPLLRGVLFYGFVCINLIVLIYFIIIPLLKKTGLLKRISYDEAADIIGKHFPEINDKLLNTIQLNRLSEENAPIKSMELLLASIDFKIEQIKPFTFHRAINLRKNLKYLPYVSVLLLIIVFVFIWNASVFTEPTHRIIHYNQVFEKPAPYSFVIENNALSTYQNENFTLHIRIEGEIIPEEAFIEINNNLYKLDQESTINYTYTFKNVQQSTKFRFVTDEVKTSFHQLNVLPKPIMINFSIALEYPPYLQKINEVVDNNGDLNIPQGTRVSWKFNTRNTDEIIINFPQKTQSTQKQSDIFTYSMRAMENLTYTVINKNQYVTNKDSLHYFINVIPDQYPQIEVISMNDSVFFDRFYFKGNISDDYGLKKLNFIYNIRDEKDTASSIQTIDIPINTSLNGQEFYYYFDAQTLNLSLGQKMTYYFEVWDNDGVNGSKSTRSSSMEFKLPSAEEIEKKSDEISTQTKSNLSNLIKEGDKILKKVEELRKKMVEKDQPSWQEKKQMEELLNQLQKLKKEVENIKKEQEKQIQMENQFHPENEELLRKQEELQKRFNELFSDEMKQIMNEIQMLMQQNFDKNKMSEMLQKIELSTEEVNKQLDQDLNLFKQLEFEKKMETTIDKIQELSKKQKELADETQKKNTDNSQLIEKQKELNTEFEQLMDDVKKLHQLNQDLDDPYKLPNTQQMESEIRQKMQEAQEQLQKNNKRKSSENQKEASDKMKSMADNMESSFEEEQSQQTEEDIQTLRQTLTNIIRASFTQEDLMLRLSKTNTQDPALQKVIEEQFKMKDILQVIEDSILAVAKRQPAVESFITKKVSTINSAQKQILESIQAIQDIPPHYNYRLSFGQAVAKQQFVMMSLNDLALMIAESIDKMNNANEGSSSCKSGSCKNSKPGSKGKQSMKSMREMQEKLNQQLEDLRKQMQNQGQKPGEGKQQGGQSMSEQLARMAAQQEAIRRMLQDYQSDLKKEGKGYDGQLERLLKEMEQTEKDLVNKIINQQTINRQHQIMTRMLQSERAEIQREKEEKREARQGKEIQRTPPAELINEKLNKQKETEMYKTIPPTLNYFYKNKVNNYFYNIP
ncbi:MAG: hypothetical protein GX330_01930 [Bacteroidales bacterium]|nr:hypothetical protein [Bacteroidales bacterium]